MRLTLVALVSVAFVAAACSSDGDKTSSVSAATTQVSGTTRTTIAIEILQAKASTLTDKLISGKYAEVTETFNGEMTAGLTPENLKTAWQQVEAQFGKYQSRGTTTKSLSAAVPGTVVFDTPMTFTKKAMKSRISFDEDGLVGGLIIVDASVS